MNCIRIILLSVLLLASSSAIAQSYRVTDGGYRTVANIRSDGTIQDASYRTIGHAAGIPRRWAAFYFFFKE